MNNVRYSRMTASDADVFEACKAAAIHDKILAMPDGRVCLVRYDEATNLVQDTIPWSERTAGMELICLASEFC